MSPSGAVFTLKGTFIAIHGDIGPKNSLVMVQSRAITSVIRHISVVIRRTSYRTSMVQEVTLVPTSRVTSQTMRRIETLHASCEARHAKSTSYVCITCVSICYCVGFTYCETSTVLVGTLRTV